jgi:hypothetical protein
VSLLVWLFRVTLSLAVLAGLRPVEAALERNAHPLRWVAFYLFIVGFHFDLLAA